MTSSRATCSTPDWTGIHPGAMLDVGASRDMLLTASCTKDARGAKVGVDASVSSIAIDPDPLNNVAQGKTNLR